MAQANQEFRALQQATQMESRKFQALSQASKARRDAAQNGTGNLK